MSSLPELRGKVVLRALQREGYQPKTRYTYERKPRPAMWYEPEYAEALNRLSSEIAGMNEEELRAYAMLLEVGWK